MTAQKATLRLSDQTQSGGSARFETIAQPRAHDFVVEQIRRQIALGVIAPGSALPPERELVKIFGVGRLTVQLAIGQLESEHVIETRRGRHGGSFVIAPSTDERALDYRLIELRRDADEILASVEYRCIIEPAATSMATRKLRVKQLRELERLQDSLESSSDDAEFMRWDTAFHLTIAELTGNRLIVDALERIRLGLNPALQLLPDTSIWHELSNHEHREILAAMGRKDASAAGQLMQSHITHAEQSIRSLLKSLARR
ncbi:FCD domain-containing protein [Phycicoccus sp.]|uniref:FadR/GntR family transcriptional regulator n=1 Tax=Phycicoccus sp. TaxID=1902410 RepID=UPI002CDBD27A|nr:FCD domain-containing protein [Phycicoccus sp.]HMM94043.1 FCD domain-containing protein [Phycicoccus sp.]